MTPAPPLVEATPSELQMVLNSFLRKSQILKSEVKYDPSIMGGMTVPTGEKYVDMSMKTKIQTLSKFIWEVF